MAQYLPGREGKVVTIKHLFSDGSTAVPLSGHDTLIPQRIGVEPGFCLSAFPKILELLAAGMTAVAMGVEPLAPRGCSAPAQMGWPWAQPASPPQGVKCNLPALQDEQRLVTSGGTTRGPGSPERWNGYS